MKINQFATNEVIFYHSIVTGDTIALELTQVTENIPKTVNPIVQTITDNWFKCEFTTVTGSTQENLTGGTIYCRYDGYYDYKLKRNGVTIEDSQFFMQGPAPIIIENQAQNTYVVTNPYAGSSGTSGQNGSSGVNGTAGSSGQSGTSGVDGNFFGSSGTTGTAGSSGSSGANGSSGSSASSGSAGSSGVNGTSGVNGSSGSSASSGSSGANGSSGSSASSGSSGLSGTSGANGTSGADGITAGRTYYFNQSQNSDISPYKVLTTVPSGAAQQTVTKTLTGNQQNVLVQQFITPQLGFSVIPGGTQRFHTHNLKAASNDQIEMYVTIQLADSSGTPIGSVLSTGNALIGWVDAINPVETTTDLTLTTTTIDPTNRMIVKIYYSNNDSTSHDVVWYTEGTAYYSFVNTTVGSSASTSGTAGTSGQNGTNGVNGTSGVSGSSGSSGANGATGPAGTSGLSGSSGTSYAAGFVQTRAGQYNFVYSVGSTQRTISLGQPMPSTNYAVTMETYTNVNQDYLSLVSKTTTGFTINVDITTNDTIEWMAVEYNTGTGGMAYTTSGTSGSSGASGATGAAGSSGTSGLAGTAGVIDIFGNFFGGGFTAPATNTVVNIKKNLFGNTPQSGNRMFLTDGSSVGTATAFTCDTTYGTLQFSWMPFIGGISGSKINTILPYKTSTVTADTKVRIMFYQCLETTSYNELVPYYGTYVPNNYFQSGFPSTNTYTNQIGSVVNYNATFANASLYTPMPKTLLGYSAVITIPAGQGNNTIGHTQMYAPDGTNGFYMPDGLIMMVIEMESTNASVGTFNRIAKTPVVTTPAILNCSPNWTNTTASYFGINLNKANCIQGSAFKIVADGGMSAYTPPTTISDAELAAIFGGPGRNSPTTSTAWGPWTTMITFA